jgi:uncharacterized coiled-coil protein SlyX
VEKAEVMADAVPEVFGIDALTHKVNELTKDVGALLRHVTQLRERLHRMESSMADSFDGLRQLIADQGAAIQQEAAQVNAKLDEQTALIQQLQDAVNNGTPPPQDLVDALNANTDAIRTIIPDTVPTPTARRK